MSKVSDFFMVTGPVHGQLFACASDRLTNHIADGRLATFRETLRLTNGRQVQATDCPCRGPVSDLQ